MSDLDLPEDFDKRLQRQLLGMEPDEAHAYAGFVSKVIERLLEAETASDPSAPDPVERRAG
jgi:hypothetical protein